MEEALENFGVAQVKKGLWFCGGKSLKNITDLSQSWSCKVLNLVSGTWTTLGKKMNKPRLMPVVSVVGSKVMVIGGATTDWKRDTGCRNTKEVLDLDYMDDGWKLEDVDENETCHRSTAR